jgi:hypothetical protein
MEMASSSRNRFDGPAIELPPDQAFEARWNVCLTGVHVGKAILNVRIAAARRRASQSAERGDSPRRADFTYLAPNDRSLGRNRC